MDKKVLGARIREERKKLSLTPKEFSEKVGISDAYLSEVELGKKMPSINTFIKIVNIIGIPADVLLRGEVIIKKPYKCDKISKRIRDFSSEHLEIVSDIIDVLSNHFNKSDDCEGAGQTEIEM